MLPLTWSSGQEKHALFQSQEMLTVLQGHLMNCSILPPQDLVINLSLGKEKLTLFQSQEMLTVLQGHLMNHRIPPPPPC